MKKTGRVHNHLVVYFVNLIFCARFVYVCIVVKSFINRTFRCLVHLRIIDALAYRSSLEFHSHDGQSARV